MRKNNDFATGVIFSVINSISLGILGVVDKIGAGQFSSSIVFSTQSVFYSLIFVNIFALSVYRSSFIPTIKTISLPTMRNIIFVGILASGLYILFRFLGLTQSTGTFATLAQVIITAETAILALIILHEKLSKTFWILFLTILVSLYFVSVGSLKFTPLQNGDSMIIVGATFVAFANIFSKFALKEVSPVILSVGRFFFGFLFLLLTMLLFFHTNIFVFSFWSVLSGLFWTVNVLTFNSAINKIGVTYATAILMIAPVYTMILEYVILKQIFTLLQIIAALVVVICGILMVIFKK